ncbi:MAG: family 10 glycosylhydrolase [Gemmatimonadota bacterium]
MAVIWVGLPVLSGCGVLGYPQGTGGNAPSPVLRPVQPPAPSQPGRDEGQHDETAADEDVPVQATLSFKVPPVRSFPEARALWVVRTALTHPDSARVMVERAHAAGFNTLLVQVRGRGDAYYRSSLEPRAHPIQGRPSTYDPLGVVIQEAHARGMAVHAWVNAYLVASGLTPPDQPDHLLRARPELLAVPRSLAPSLYSRSPQDPGYAQALLRFAADNVERVEGVYLSPAHPEVRRHLIAVLLDLLEGYPLDGIHLDYVRYPGPDHDYSVVALDRFREWAAPRIPGTQRDELNRGMAGGQITAWPDALPHLWDDFRREQVTTLVRDAWYALKARNPRLVVSAAVMANAHDAFGSRYQDWERWLQEGWLDVVVPMAYTQDDATFSRQIREAVAAAGPDRVWAGVGVYQNSFPGALSKVRLARREGASGVVLFSYDWTVQPQGVAAAGGDYLGRMGREAFGTDVAR